MASKGKLEKKGASKDSKEKGKTVTEAAVTLESFVSQMLPLIDLEKEAEIAASLDSLATLKPEVAERRGALLLNLKCSDVQGYWVSYGWSYSQIEVTFFLHIS